MILEKSMSSNATSIATRQKLTLGWGGRCAPVPDVVFVDAVSHVTLAAAAELRAAPEPQPARAVMPPPAVQSVREQHKGNVLRMLDAWADWIRLDAPIAYGAPSKCVGAPDARIHSFEDMEIETDKRVTAEVNTAVWELPTMEREAVMRHYHINRAHAWQGDFEKLFFMAIESLYEILRKRVAC